MKRNKINETSVVIVTATVEPNLGIVVDNMIAEWGGTPYAQLSVVLVYLKFLAAVHQNHHWTSMGDPFYGDHLLFQRLYDATNGEIDSVAEKAIGLGCTANVDLMLQTKQVLRLVKGYGMTTTIPQPTDLAKRSLLAEKNFLSAMNHICECLKECNLMTHGLDNLLAGIEDKHEGHVYLLKQRCAC